MSKIIKLEGLSEEEARWVKYRREKLAEQGRGVVPGESCVCQIADPGQLAAQARAEAEQIRRDAFESGFEKGRQEGLAKAAEQVQTALAFLRNLTHSLVEEEQKIISQIEPDIVKLAVAVAQRIIGKEVTVDREVVKRCVIQATEKILEREKLIIYVNPVDLPVIMGYKEDLARTFDGIKEIEVIGSENGISPGGCTVETDLLKANGRIEAQLEEILNGLLGLGYEQAHAYGEAHRRE